MRSRREKRIKSKLKRSAPSRTPREHILIVCEGSKTEPGYFKMLKQKLRMTNVVVEVCGKECGSAPISVIKYAKSKRDNVGLSPIRAEFEAVWCVIDVEAPHPHKSLAQALDMARENDFDVALSNPCFEFWYLLHFRKTSRLMHSCDKVVRLLRKEYGAYKKNDPSIAEALYPKTDSAIKHSKEILKERCLNGKIQDCNSSTNVHIIVEYLQNLAETT